MSVNRVILLGYLGRDPEVRYLDHHVCVANFTLATTERGYTTSTGVQVPDRTEWHNIVLWRGLAEMAEKYLRKGSQLYVEGKLRTRTWEDANGVRRSITEVYGEQIEMIGKRSEQGATPLQKETSTILPSASLKDSTAFNTNNLTDDLPF